MTDEKIFKLYIQIAEVIAGMFAPVVETAIQDYYKKGGSLIAIFNGHVTGRKVGDPITELGVKRLSGKVPDIMLNYKNKNWRGTPIKSSAVAIRNEQGKIIGALGINMDTSYFAEYSKFIDKFISASEHDSVGKDEGFHIGNAADEVKDGVQAILVKNGWLNRQLSKKERLLMIEQLLASGVFNKRGAVATIAQQMNITRQSVYKYVHKLEFEKK